MAVCSRCGGQLNPQERFCGHCGMDTQATVQAAAPQQTAPQQVVTQQTTPQVIYTPPAAQAAPGQRCGCTARAAMGLGIGGGLLGILWGALGPYLSLKLPDKIGWFYGANPYMTGIEPVVLMIVGLVLGILAVLGAAMATKALPLSRILLVIAGLVGFLVGPSWLIPGALILAAAGLAIAAKPQQ
jgi:hypothetical protein